jgi:hypothetical protein
MFSQPGTLEVICDAPPYEVVRACEAVGFRTPLDVRWVRACHVVQRRPPGRGLFSFRRWLELLGVGKPAGRACSCGDRLPDLRWHRFVYPAEGQSDYLLGQCRRCHTVYWDDA